MNPIRVVLVDNHRLVRQGLRSLLDPDPDFEVVAEAGDGAQGLRAVAEHQPDVVILDIKLDDANGTTLCEPILSASPQTAILILTAFIDRSLVETCLAAGAKGYLLKDTEHLHLKESLRTVVAGHTALDPRAADYLVNHVKHRGASPEMLTPRELEVLGLIAKGLTNREIAERLYLSQHTIKGYVKEILAKMGVHSRLKAAMLARDRGAI